MYFSVTMMMNEERELGMSIAHEDFTGSQAKNVFLVQKYLVQNLTPKLGRQVGCHQMQGSSWIHFDKLRHVEERPTETVRLTRFFVKLCRIENLYVTRYYRYVLHVPGARYLVLVPTGRFLRCPQVPVSRCLVPTFTCLHHQAASNPEAPH